MLTNMKNEFAAFSREIGSGIFILLGFLLTALVIVAVLTDQIATMLGGFLGMGIGIGLLLAFYAIKDRRR